MIMIKFYASNPTYAVHHHSLNGRSHPILETNMVLFIEVSPIWTSHTMVLHIVENIRPPITVYTFVWWFFEKRPLSRAWTLSWIINLLFHILEISIVVNVLWSINVCFIFLLPWFIETLTGLFFKIKSFVAFTAIVLIEIPKIR